MAWNPTGRVRCGMAAMVWVLSLAWTSAQTTAPVPLRAEEAFKNIQVLRGIPVDEFMNTMGFISASLGLNCQDCHTKESGGDWAKYADETPIKQTSRRMLLMVNAINAANFGGRQLVTCNTCHRGVNKPNVRPSLLNLYGEPPPDEPGDVFEQAPGQPAPAAVFTKYLDALGGAARVAALTSLVARGTYAGFSDAEKTPAELYARASGARAIVQRGPSGDTVTTFDGRRGWLVAPVTARPLPVIDITGQELEGLALESAVLFPSRIAQALTGWRAGFPQIIDDRDVQPVQGTTPTGAVVTLCFDVETGLLTRLVRVSSSPIGPIVSQIDYQDYRDVSGVKMPFRSTLTWLSGRTVFEWRDVEANVPVHDARFVRPPVVR